METREQITKPEESEIKFRVVERSERDSQRVVLENTTDGTLWEVTDERAEELIARQS